MAKFDQFADGGGGAPVIDKPKPAEKKKPKTHAEKLAEWREKQGGEAAYQNASRSCCMCAPTRAQMFLVDNWVNGPASL